jgi:O-acetyl-ADP-ribose deacetylase (regulator of RNase III)
MCKITMVEKNLLSITKGGILHGVNAQGKMNSGVAKAIREKYPRVYLDYVTHVNRKVINPIRNTPSSPWEHIPRQQLLRRALLGEVIVSVISPQLTVFSGFTQQYYGSDGDVYASIPAIVNCIQACLMSPTVKEHGLYIPKIGCGLGGLHWSDVSKAIRLATPNDVTITVCLL